MTDTVNARKGWIGLALALGVPLLLTFGWHGATQPGAIQFAREAVWWGIAAGVLWWALSREKLSPAYFHIVRPRWSSLGWGLAFGVILIMLIGVCYALIFPALGVRNDPAQLGKIASQPVWMIFLLTVRAGVVEEWLFRFYAITRLHTLTGSKWLASLVPGVVFVALHAPSWGLLHLLPVTFAAIALTLLYWWRKDFWCSALAHFIADFIPFAGMALGAGHAPG